MSRETAVAEHRPDSPDPAAQQTSAHSPDNFRAFILIWVAQLVARIGNGLTAFGLAVYVYQATGSSTAVAAVTLAAFLPGLLLTPFAGVLADRFDRRLLMILSDTFSAIGLVLLLLAMSAGFTSVAVICACVAFSSAFTSIMDPAYRATVSDLLTPQQYARAGGMVQFSSAAQFLISPALAGVILLATNIATIMVIDLATMAVTIIAMLLVWRTLSRARQSANQAEQPTDQTSFWQEFSFGLAFLASHRAVTVMMLLITLVTFCLGFVQTLLTPMVIDLANEEALGLVRSISAVGLVVASVIISVFGMGTHHRRYIAIALALAGGFVAGMGISQSVLGIGAFGFALFLTLPVMNTSIEVLVRSAIPNQTQGRVWALVGTISQLGYVVAYATSGVAADYVFNPLLRPGGQLTASLGWLIGIGPSRGIGLMFVLVGLLLVIMAVVIYTARSIRLIERDFTNQLAQAER